MVGARRTERGPDDMLALLEQAFDTLPRPDRVLIEEQLAREGVTLGQWFARRLAERMPPTRRLH